MEEKNDKLFSIIVIILIIILLGGTGYLVFDRVIKKDNNVKKEKIKSDETVIKDISEYKEKILTIPLASCVIEKDQENCNKTHAYSNKKVTIDDINDSDIIYTTIALNNFVDDEGKVSISDVTAAVVEDYGEDGVVKDYEISFTDDYTSFTLADNKYVLAGGEEPHLTKEDVDNMFITKVTEDSGNFYVYNKNIAYTLENTEPGTNEGTVIIYKDFSKKKEATRINYSDISNDWLTEDELKKQLMKDYTDYVIKFKHTFKIGNDDEYYYYSSEPIK